MKVEKFTSESKLRKAAARAIDEAFARKQARLRREAKAERRRLVAAKVVGAILWVGFYVAWPIRAARRLCRR